MRLSRTIAFWMLAVGLLVCHLVVIQHSLTARFWEDEAFNLTVPLNLLAGLGYSSDGALSGSTITPFDARISTGPAVLLPVAGMLLFGGDPVISARLVPVMFWSLLIAGLAVLGARVGGRWAALLGAAAPLAFNGLGSISPIQGPADLLGEIPAAALLVWALIAVRKRPWLAGLLVGLAIQAKLIALLALPAFAVMIWVGAPGRGWARIGQTFVRGWLPLVMVGVPTLLFELWALIALGPSGFVDHLRQMKRFLLSGGQSGQATTVSQKLETLSGAWFVPGWAAWLTAAIVVALVIAGLIEVRRRGRLRRRSLALALTAAVGALVFVSWWSTAAHTPLWVRHPAVGVLAFFPALVIVAYWGAHELMTPRVSRADSASTGAEPVNVRRIAGGVLAAALSASLVWSIAGHVQQTSVPRGETLATQRADVAVIAEWVDETQTAWLAAAPWGAAVAPIVMSGAHVGLFDAPSMARTPRLTGQQCDTEVLVEARHYRVCAPAE
ncbi:hypothetical protein [Microbacterium esteraromaticum]|uniref:hypothetical protein n=1 Tax=Microbacterium esteraromaticum TaxID=57043 RepID=UPI00195BE1C4|nr:hypothetical protein [Microbacterium esteraromaticum]MBM7466740.1 hypothetical protein [Microbacterium esteraromaticum]